MHSQIKLSLGLRFPQDGSVGRELTHGLLQVPHGGRAEKALDFNSDEPISLLGGNGRLFRAEIDEEISTPERKPERIIRDGPTIRKQSVDNRIVMDIFGGHGSLTNSMRRISDRVRFR